MFTGLVDHVGKIASISGAGADGRRLQIESRFADFVVGEFNTEGAWGGTAWEGLAAGRPVFQAVNFMGDVFRQRAGYDLPPFLHVGRESDILAHLQHFEVAPDEYAEIGRRGKAWFQRHQGIELAREYVRLLERLPCAGDAGRDRSETSGNSA